MLRLPRNLRFEPRKVLCLPRNLRVEAHACHENLRFEVHTKSYARHEICTSSHFEVHKVLRLLKNLHFEPGA